MARAISPDPADYYVAPPLMIGGTKPAILMILSKDIKMYAPAYAAPADHDGDGRMDIGFNPSIEYTGIFDPYSCYAYVKGVTDWTAKDGYDFTKRGHFIRVGASIPDFEDGTGPYPDQTRLPTEIINGYKNGENARPGYRAPRSKTGICPQRRDPGSGVHLDSNNLIWSGNWLNWISSSRLDVIRQVLYGGKRVIDTATSTYLTAHWLPENAGVWAYDDFTKYFWLDYNEGSPYYDSLKYTPVDPDRWGGKYRRLHVYGRVDNHLYVIDNVWFMRQKEDVLNHEGFRSYNAFYPSRDRAQYTPVDYVLNSFADSYKVAELELVVEACKPLTQKQAWDLYYGHILGRTDKARYKGRVPASQAEIEQSALIEAGDYCERYGANYKPVGVLQKYTKLDQALFGLITGAFNNVNRWDAGWLRQNVTSIRNHINADGTFKGDSTNNIFKMLDNIAQATKPALAPWKEKPKNGLPVIDTVAQSAGKGWRDPYESNFGNPIGEMLYQGLLYFAKDSKSSYSSWPATLQNSESVTLPRLGASGFDAWRSPLAVDSGDCLKPVILLLSDITTSHDGDMLPGSPHGMRSGGDVAPALSLNFPDADRFHDAKGLGKTFNMAHYLNVITELEGLAGKEFYIANTNTGAAGAETVGSTSRQPPASGDTNLCVPRVLSSLADVRGICPSAPQTYGTYSVAAAAYYGNTHTFSGGLNNVQTYVVALPTIFPEINLESKNRVISISPVAMAIQYPCGNNGEGDATYCKTADNSPTGISYVGPFATNVIQWRSDDNGRVYSGAVFAGFSSRLEGEGDDYQLDAPVRYYFDLIRECEATEYCGAALYQSQRYGDRGTTSGYPSHGTERAAVRKFLDQVKYTAKYGYAVDSNLKSKRDNVNGWGGKAERDVAKKILLDFKDGRYAGAPVKRRREFVYRNWDPAMRPNYILSSERPKYYDVAAYEPSYWSELPGILMLGTGILSSDIDPDPALMESYAQSWYGELSNTNRQNAMRLLPGASGYKYGNSDTNVDLVASESASLFIDRPFKDIGYEEVMDVYGYIGEPGKIYKKVSKPQDIDKAVGVAVFVYSLYEDIDGSDRDRAMNIGYYMHGGYNYAKSKEEDPQRQLGVANGTYLEIQNEHNYMGGSSYWLKDGATTARKDRGLMTIAHELNTPPTCFRAGMISTQPMNFTAADRDGRFFRNNKPANLQMPGFLTDFDVKIHADAVPSCGSARLPLTSTRFFRFPPVSVPLDPPTYLPNPLFLAAKYGGFNDINRDGIPQKEEWDSTPAPNGDGIPDNYFYAQNLSQLKSRLVEAFEKIMSTLTVGTSSSASINSIMGGGIAIRTYYQTVHNPYNAAAGTNEVKWIGGTYALFVDPFGNLREDTNRNGVLDLDCGTTDSAGSTRGGNAKGDWIVEFVNCKTLKNSSEAKACQDVRDKSDLKSIVQIFPDVDGSNTVDYARSAFYSLESISTVWNLAQNLSQYKTKDQLLSGRKVYFYHNEVSGSLPLAMGASTQFLPNKAAALSPHLLTPSAAEATKLIEYTLGWDQTSYRSRQTMAPWAVGKGSIITCRLGDVINAQPIIVGPPFSGYDVMYNDPSYGQYRLKYADRKNLAVVGANDGMLHALNLGKHVDFSMGKNGYVGADGQEQWAFIPQAVLPHLQWMAREDYAHTYYVDLTPFVAEVKDESKSGADQWRTVLITSLRFGGRAIELAPASKNTPAKYSYSEVFALDITDTDKPPTLLWRFSHPQMGLVVARPIVVRNGSDWRVIVASGPTYDLFDAATNQTVPGAEGRLAYRGYSNQSAKLFYFDALKGPGTNNASTTTVDTNRPKSFFAQSFLVKAPTSSVVRSGSEITWKHKLAYFSLNQSAPDDRLLCIGKAGDIDPFLSSSSVSDKCTASKFSNYGYLDKGGVWRLNLDGSPSSWTSNLQVFYDADRPVSGAVNATTDANGNLWIIFGSGRYWHDEDARLCEGAGNTKECRINHLNYLYGLKEPTNAQGQMTFGPVDDSKITDVSNVYVFPDGTIRVVTSSDQNGATSTTNTFGGSITNYSQLSAYIGGSSSAGYKKVLHTNSTAAIDPDEMANPKSENYGDTDWWKGLSSEMLIQQVAVAVIWGQSHIAFSTFLAENVSCGSAGRSYQIMLDSFTGLPSPVMGSERFKTYNKFQEMPSIGSGDEVPISDHYGYFEGMNVPTTVVTTYVNGQVQTAFVATTSSGEGGESSKRKSNGPDGPGVVDPPENTPKGTVAWREVLDNTNASDTDE
jgi:hypothetical protein